MRSKHDLNSTQKQDVDLELIPVTMKYRRATPLNEGGAQPHLKMKNHRFFQKPTDDTDYQKLNRATMDRNKDEKFPTGVTIHRNNENIHVAEGRIVVKTCASELSLKTGNNQLYNVMERQHNMQKPQNDSTYQKLDSTTREYNNYEKRKSKYATW